MDSLSIHSSFELKQKILGEKKKRNPTLEGSAVGRQLLVGRLD